MAPFLDSQCYILLNNIHHLASPLYMYSTNDFRLSKSTSFMMMTGCLSLRKEDLKSCCNESWLVMANSVWLHCGTCVIPTCSPLIHDAPQQELLPALGESLGGWSASVPGLGARKPSPPYPRLFLSLVPNLRRAERCLPETARDWRSRRLRRS